MPLAWERKSWSLTGVGTRCYFRPAFLKLPTSSRFLASTLMMGLPLRENWLRSRVIWRNCWSRVERFPAAIFLQFTRSEKCSLSTGHGVRIQLQQRGQSLIAPAAQLQRLQAGIQTALALVQQPGEQDQ